MEHLIELNEFETGSGANQMESCSVLMIVILGGARITIQFVGL
jgi:hypothetical protein